MDSLCDESLLLSSLFIHPHLYDASASEAKEAQFMPLVLTTINNISRNDVIRMILSNVLERGSGISLLDAEQRKHSPDEAKGAIFIVEL